MTFTYKNTIIIKNTNCGFDIKSINDLVVTVMGPQHDDARHMRSVFKKGIKDVVNGNHEAFEDMNSFIKYCCFNYL